MLSSAQAIVFFCTIILYAWKCIIIKYSHYFRAALFLIGKPNLFLALPPAALHGAFALVEMQLVAAAVVLGAPAKGVVYLHKHQVVVHLIVGVAHVGGYFREALAAHIFVVHEWVHYARR